jgi:hypothetical protein
MRKTTILLLLLTSSPIFAEDRWRGSIMRVQHGYSAALAYAPTPAWDVEAAIGEETYLRTITVFSQATPVPMTYFDDFRVHPIELFATRRFAAGERLSPYVRLGARYVRAPGDAKVPGVKLNPPLFLPPPSHPPGHGDRLSAQAAAGVRLRLTPHTALRFEAGRLLREHRGPFDPLNRVSGGLSWLF